ncbi:BZ3500_MvSof-1268-A1-R1_Chr5-2g08020 [Microbotryum saponariae]|uniref:BZ3500_MvSof-1268-A1-R1_Chr5-2g08020 protein n=1 Tax=Microbotryum saponariae TaxID=289078 RepID=A0A2X0LJ59_9BASI|nr:BZ3500_MvSof-1268-A1-R1_Chr5-2g08020 [Microbotryum saponariae]SDA05889.1 BZ3501_MvSof-1269-A2-R1_Chr5-2g07842 [Microbotryum saponariae]
MAHPTSPTTGYLKLDADPSANDTPTSSTCTVSSNAVASTSTSNRTRVEPTDSATTGAWSYNPSSYASTSHPTPKPHPFLTSSSSFSSSLASPSPSEDEDDLSDLSSESSWTSSRIAYEDEQQWQASMRQLQLIWNVVALPFAAKWAGRKCAYWIFGRWQWFGLGDKRFWFGTTMAKRVPETWWRTTTATATTTRAW